MDILEQFLHSIAYKFPKGYPDMKDPKDVELLYKLINETVLVPKQTTISEGTEEDIFKEFYAKNNSLRYCNGSHYEFQDADLKHRYDAWYKSLSKATTFNMYYGNGIVD